MQNSRNHVAAAAMRNEGPFIMEWVAWYTSLGFDDLLIATNDCTDHSEEMLGLLAENGWVHHLPHTPHPKRSAKHSAHQAIRNHQAVIDADWMFLCDTDEFLVIHAGDGTVQDFLGEDIPDVHGIAVHWKCFGTSGHEQWDDELVHRRFTMAAVEQSEANIFFKSLVYKPSQFRRLREHRPQGFTGGTWGTPPNVWVDSSGKPLPKFAPDRNDFQYTRHTRITHANAQVNHYIVRSQESFDYKRGRLDPTAGKDRYTERFFEKFNRNDVQDLTALRHKDRFDGNYQQITSIPGIKRLHHLCCADYMAEVCKKRGDRPDENARYLRHMALADAAK